MTDTTIPSVPGFEIEPGALRHLADAAVNVELDTGDMILNLGPQHPATHGTLRLVVRLDGERVIAADPVIGYMHRGYEKLTEFRTYPQITTLINRIDWLSSFANEVPFIHGAELLMDIEAPPRAQYIRTILTELSRIATIYLFLGEMGLQVGALTPAFWGFRDREHVLNLIEGATGGRFHPNFNRIGGLKDDLPWGWIAECREVMKKILDGCDDFEDVLVGNEIFEARTRGIGIIPGELGAAYGVSGANLRASGIDWDLRRDGKPYLVYPELDFKVWTHGDGDSFARYWVRLQETREAARHGAADARPDPVRPGDGQGPAHHQGARGRGLGGDREPARPDGLLHRVQGRDGPVPREDPLRELQQRLDPAVAAARRVRPRRDHDPRLALLHPGGHRPVSAVTFALEVGWGTTLAIKTLVVLAIIPLGALILGYTFLLKMMSHMQSRLGPMDPGGFHGWFQLVGDGMKFLQKEDIMPAEADRRVFALAPAVVVLSTFLVFLVIPTGPRLVVKDLDVGVFYALAVSSLSVIGVLMAGWASANKFALLGALRAAAQLIAYELPLLLAVVGVVIQAGTMDLQGIVAAQQNGSIFGVDFIGNPYILTQFIGFFLFLVAARRSSPRPRSTCRSPSPSSSPGTWSSTRASASSSSSSASSAPRSRSRRSPPRSSSAAGRSPACTVGWPICSGRSCCSPS